MGRVPRPLEDRAPLVSHPWVLGASQGAFDAWARLESDFGRELVLNTGLDHWPEGAAIPMDDCTSSLGAVVGHGGVQSDDPIRAPLWSEQGVRRFDYRIVDTSEA